MGRMANDRDKYKQQCEKLKVDLIKFKKQMESEKESHYKQKMDEIV